jgi:hypothetical protein
MHRGARQTQSDISPAFLRSWRFTVGDQVKLLFVNELDSGHPLQRPFHWKDAVLVRTGETVDVLLDVTNPGRWMAHCHIAEHRESGVMFGFNEAPSRADPRLSRNVRPARSERAYKKAARMQKGDPLSEPESDAAEPENSRRWRGRRNRGFDRVTC